MQTNSKPLGPSCRAHAITGGAACYHIGRAVGCSEQTVITYLIGLSPKCKHGPAIDAQVALKRAEQDAQIKREPRGFTAANRAAWDRVKVELTAGKLVTQARSFEIFNEIEASSRYEFRLGGG